jgi:two-component system response regulator
MTDRPILLVEDNADDEKLTLRALRKNNILNDVVVARDGVEALDYLFNPDRSLLLPQVVLLDLNLPRINGVEVLRRVRSDERTKILPVVILSSSRQEEDIARSYTYGANAYVRKPVEFAEFIDAVRTLGLFWLLLSESPPPAHR